MSVDPAFFCSVYRNLDVQVAGVAIKAAPGQVYGWYIYNNAASVRYVKLYDKAATPTNSNTPKLTIPIPPNAGANVGPNANGLKFTAGIGIRASTTLADDDSNAAPTANDVIVNLFYV